METSSSIRSLSHYIILINNLQNERRNCIYCGESSIQYRISKAIFNDEIDIDKNKPVVKKKEEILTREEAFRYLRRTVFK